jgi:REP element-mobilizing transposase RayT
VGETPTRQPGGRPPPPTAGGTRALPEPTTGRRNPTSATRCLVAPETPVRSDDRSAGVPPAVSGASRPRFGEVTIRDRGRLPHWEKESATYFITFRLGDSLPRTVLERIEFERQNLIKTARQMEREPSADERKRMQQLSTRAVELYLDSGSGACHLRNPDVAKMVADALRHFDSRRYRLFAWCIMPNHVHVVARVFPGHSLAETVHSWKSYTAKQANKLRGVKGGFWQREYYDHLIRDAGEFERALQYVANNPAKAGLTHWRWVWVVGGRDARPTAGETLAVLGHAE